MAVGGEGTSGRSEPSCSEIVCNPSTRPTPSHVAGAITIAAANTVTMQAASVSLRPRWPDSHVWTGYSATARTTLQARMPMKGRTRTKHQKMSAASKPRRKAIWITSPPDRFCRNARNGIAHHPSALTGQPIDPCQTSGLIQIKRPPATAVP